MVVSKPEMENDRPDGRMDELARGLPVGKIAHGRQPLIELRGWGRFMEDLAIHVANDHGFVVAPKSARGGGVVQRPVRDKPMNLENQVRGERLLLHLTDSLHGEVVVENHFFTSVPRFSTTADHVLRDPPRGGRPLQLAGRDCLLDQGPNVIAVLGLGVRDLFGHLDQSTRVQVDLVEEFLDWPC